MLQIPGYEIKHKIGEGGSRIAYLALAEFCKEPTVVKVFKQGSGLHKRIEDHRSRHSLVEILEREVNELRRISNPHIIRIYHHGVAHDTFYLEEEYMPGGTIEERLGTLTQHHILHLFKQMTEGVRALHTLGLLVRAYRYVISQDVRLIAMFP